MSNAVGHAFDPRSGQTKDYKIGICCFSTKHVALRKKSKGIRSYKLVFNLKVQAGPPRELLGPREK
jgi:hypothetical protein